MEIIIAVLVGYILGAISPTDMKAFVVSVYKDAHNYLASPSTDRLELDWSVYQALKLIAPKASERWYEARAHIGQGLLKSLLTTVGVIYLVQISLQHNSFDHGVTKVYILSGFQSFERLMDKVPVLIESYMNTVDRDLYHYERTFIAGHNVVE